MNKKSASLTLLLLAVSYLFGLLTVEYHLPPYYVLKHIKNYILSSPPGDTNTLNQQFIQPIINRDALRYPPVKSYDDLTNRIQNYRIHIDSFERAFDKIEIKSWSWQDHIFTLIYKYLDKIDTAFAYFKSSLGNKHDSIGINIIPGSGINQSSAIYYNLEDNYQSNIDDISEKYGDVFILVKPNEDFLAIHNGSKKLSGESYISYLLNLGYSYSAYYMIQGLALSKFIKMNYKSFYICGISQGGFAALINSLQSKPQKAVIASGFSILLNSPQPSEINQLIIPNYLRYYTSARIKSQIKNCNTHYLFTWGTKENGVYGKDAADKLSALFIKDLSNVKTYIHSEGHIYYEPPIDQFLRDTSLLTN